MLFSIRKYHRNQLIEGHPFLTGTAILEVQVLLQVNNCGYNDFYNFRKTILMHYLLLLTFNSKYLLVKSSRANF